jgi:hypothetical protein
MAKKDFTGGLSSLIGETPSEEKEQAKPVGRPVTQTKEITKTSQIGTKEAETRATFIVNEGLLDKVKAIAYWDRVQIKDVVGEALTAYATQYEKKNGPLKNIPSKGK